MTMRRARAPYEFRGLTLDEFQIEAIISLQQDMSTLVSAPTGTGKSLIADYLVDDSLRLGRSVVYTAPIKALVNQKYRDFRATFGAERTGIMTGDLSENRDAPLLVMTTEVLRNMLLRGGRLDADWIVFDEIHYIDHPQRGTVWEEAILLLPKPLRLLGLSATVPNIDQLAAWLEQVQGEPVASIVHEERAVPMRHLYFTSEGRAVPHKQMWEHVTGGDLKADSLSVDESSREFRRPRDDHHSTSHLDVIDYVRSQRLFPCIYFVFSRQACEQMARELARRRSLLRAHEREAVHMTVRQILHRSRLRPPDVPGLSAMQEMWYRGIGVHHAGLVPIVKHIVEHLLERRILRVVYATETFAVGVNMPVRTVCFDTVVKFDGRHHRLLTQQEFLQMAGRAGRRGLDRAGTVLIRADADAMAETGWRDWEQALLEPITSRLSLSYTTVLNLVERFANDAIQARKSWPGALPADHKQPVFLTPMVEEQLGSVAATVGAWLFRSLFAMQSERPVVATARLTAQFAEKVRELRRLGYLQGDTGTSKQGVFPSRTSDRPGDEEFGIQQRAPLSLTAKGIFCRSIWVKDLLVSELAFDGTLARLRPAELAGWAAATVWESRPQDHRLPPAAPGWLAAVQLAADRIMRWTGPKLRNVLTVEARIAPMVSRWAEPDRGDNDLAKFLKGYYLEAGDFVSLCRQTVDLLRQIATAAGDVIDCSAADAGTRGGIDLDELWELRHRALGAAAAVDRDIVAASRSF